MPPIWIPPATPAAERRWVSTPLKGCNCNYPCKSICCSDNLLLPCVLCFLYVLPFQPRVLHLTHSHDNLKCLYRPPALGTRPFYPSFATDHLANGVSGYVCVWVQFKKAALSPSTVKGLNQHWVSCKGSWTNEQFWQHEWQRHGEDSCIQKARAAYDPSFASDAISASGASAGTCSGLSQQVYFQKALDLFQRYANYCTKASPNSRKRKRTSNKNHQNNVNRESVGCGKYAHTKDVMNHSDCTYC